MRIAAVLLLLSGLGWAKDASIYNVTSLPHQANALTVQFEDDSAPPETQAVDRTRWAAWCLNGEGKPPAALGIDTASHNPATKFADTHTVVLTFTQDVTTQCQAVQVMFLAGNFPTGRWTRKTEQPEAAAAEAPSLWDRLFAPPGSDGDPNYSLSFAVVPAVGSKPLYTIDGSIHHKIVGGVPDQMAFTATAKTDSSTKADLDSFTWKLNFSHVPQGALSWKADLAGMEFDKNANLMNEISSAALVWSRSGGKTGSNGKEEYAWTLKVNAGVELGDNFRNQFTIASQPARKGTGFIFRGAPGIRFDFAYPTANPKHAVLFNSSYTVRLPARQEVFVETRGVTNPVPLLGTNPRHYVETNLTFKLTDYFGFKLQHTYGALPPTFKFSDNRGSIGIVFQASQPK